MPMKRKALADALSKDHWVSLSLLCGALMLITWCIFAV